MGRAKIIGLFLFIIFLMIGCNVATNQLQSTMRPYYEVVNSTLSEDFTLKIWFVDPEILTRKPLTEDELKKFDGVKEIVVESQRMREYIGVLRALSAAKLTPVTEDIGINARIYYEFSTNNEKVLGVTINQVHNGVFVNGIAVKDSAIFYDVIIPFLSKDDCNLLGI